MVPLTTFSWGEAVSKGELVFVPGVTHLKPTKKRLVGPGWAQEASILLTDLPTATRSDWDKIGKQDLAGPSQTQRISMQSNATSK